MITALALALSLMLADAQPAAAPPPDSAPAGPPPADATTAVGEPLPPGAPTDSYELSAWCYGALDEYLTIYERVKPDLRDIDHMFGTPVVEDEPYQSDMAAARVELKMIGASVTEAEKASPRPISEDGVASIKQGRAIWSVAEAKPRRDLARAWMLWALPDRCDSNAKELTQRSIVFGRALNYNAAPAPAPSAPAAQPPADATAPPAAAEPAAQASPTTDTNVPADTSMNAAGAPAAPAPAPTTTDPAIPPYPTPTQGTDHPATAPSPQP